MITEAQRVLMVLLAHDMTIPGWEIVVDMENEYGEYRCLLRFWWN